MAFSYRTASGKTLSASAAAFGRGKFVALGKEFYREGTAIMAASYPLVPVNTGALRGSGYVTEPVITADGTHLIIEIGYGGVAAKINPKTMESAGVYALTVHEDLQAHHKVGSAKYLQIPFDAARAGMANRITSGMKGGGGLGSAPPDMTEGPS